MNRAVAVMSLALATLFVSPVMAQGAAEANGTIIDGDGNPIAGVVVTFSPRGNPAMVYSGKTNKKGRYFVSGLYTPKEADRWDVSVEADGYLPIKVTVESRNVNKVLIGDIMTQELRAGSKIADIMIRPLGRATVDLTMAPADEVQSGVAAQQPGGSLLPAGEGSEGGEQAEAQQDPWNEALTLASSGDLESSIPFFEEALEKKPESVERAETLAKVLYELERYDEAEAAAIQASGLDPERLDSRKILAGIYIARGDLGQAGSVLEEARLLAPQDMDILDRIAYVASQSGRPEDAIVAYEGITAADPGRADAWLALGGLYAQAGRMDESEQAYQKVVEIKPSEAYQTFYNLGVLIMNRPKRGDGDTRRAIEAFTKSVEINPQYGQAYQQLAYALLGMGDQPAALKALQDYIRVSPNSPDADRVRGMIKSLSK